MSLLRNAAALSLLALAGAAAPTAPVLVPAKDTLVAYHLAPAAGEPIDVLVSTKAGGKLIRVDLPDHTYMVAFPTSQALMLVVPAAHTFADLPWAEGPQTLFLLDPHAAWTQKGEATVAGVRCTQWEATKEPSKNLVCLTADGVMMRNQFQDARGRRSLIEGLGMKEVPLQEEAFAPPQGYQRVDPFAPQLPAVPAQRSR